MISNFRTGGTGGLIRMDAFFSNHNITRVNKNGCTFHNITRVNKDGCIFQCPSVQDLHLNAQNTNFDWLILFCRFKYAPLVEQGLTAYSTTDWSTQDFVNWMDSTNFKHTAQTSCRSTTYMHHIEMLHACNNHNRTWVNTDHGIK